MKTVIVVGTGKNQLSLLTELRRQNYNIIGFDRDSKSPGKILCNKFEEISTWDFEGAIKWLKSLNITFSGVACFSYGNAVYTQQMIAYYFQLPLLTPSRMFLEMTRNKYFLREKLNSASMSNLKDFVINRNTNQIMLPFKNKERYVLKPLTGGSSMDIKIIHNKSEYNEKLKMMLMKYTEVLIQPFLSGKEYRATCIIKDKQLKFLKVFKKENFRDTFFTSRLKTINKEAVYKQFIIFLEELVEKFSIQTTVLKIDFIYLGQHIEVIEIDIGRPGDYLDESFCKSICTYNFVQNYINLIFERDVKKHLKSIKSLGIFDYLYRINAENFSVNYNIINEAIKQKIKGPYELIKIQDDGDVAKIPKGNFDAICGIIHKDESISNYSLNKYINDYLINNDKKGS